MLFPPIDPNERFRERRASARRRKRLRRSAVLCTFFLAIGLLGVGARFVGSTETQAPVTDLATLAATQVVNRGSVSAASVLLVVIAAEEMPAGSRAYALSLLSMTGALGAGMALWVLPVADLGLGAWRILYVIPLLFIPVVLRFGRLLPESRRYVRPHRTVGLAGHYHRLALMAGASRSARDDGCSLARTPSVRGSCSRSSGTARRWAVS